MSILVVDKIEKLRPLLLVILLSPLLLHAQFEDEYTENYAARLAREDQQKKEVLAFIDRLAFAEGYFQYEEVVAVPGVSAKELYRRGRSWFAEAFVNSNYVIRFDDKDSNAILGKGFMKFSFITYLFSKYEEKLTFIVELIAKDGRYKFRFYNLELHEMHPLPSELSEYPKQLDLVELLGNMKRGGTKAFKNYKLELAWTLQHEFNNVIAYLKMRMKKSSEAF